MSETFRPANLPSKSCCQRPGDISAKQTAKFSFAQRIKFAPSSLINSLTHLCKSLRNDICSFRMLPPGIGSLSPALAAALCGLSCSLAQIPPSGYTKFWGFFLQKCWNLPVQGSQGSLGHCRSPGGQVKAAAAVCENNPAENNPCWSQGRGVLLFLLKQTLETSFIFVSHFDCLRAAGNGLPRLNLSHLQ